MAGLGHRVELDAQLGGWMGVGLFRQFTDAKQLGGTTVATLIVLALASLANPIALYGQL